MYTLKTERFLQEKLSQHSYSTMRGYAGACSLLAVVALLLALHGVNGGNPYRGYTWKITYGDIYPLGVKQQVQFAQSLSLSLSVCVS